VRRPRWRDAIPTILNPDFDAVQKISIIRPFTPQKMTSFGKFTLRFAAYGLVLVYLACDLLVFHGPLYHRLQAAKPDSAESIADARRRGVAALVYGREITLSQIDHAVRARLAAEGGPVFESLPESQLRLHRYATLGRLIDHELLRVKVMHSTSELTISEAEINAAHARIVGRFPNDEAFQAALAKSGITPENHRDRIAARIQQIKFAESRIDPLAGPDDPLLRHRAANEFREQLRNFEENRDRIHIHHAVLRGE